MLPREHRLTSSRDHRHTMRHGARSGGGGLMVAMVVADLSDTERSDTERSDTDRSGLRQARWRCGFVVSKAVGNAVVRHRTQRRLRHIVFDLMREGVLETPENRRLDIVIRAFPEVVDLDHRQLRAEVLRCARRAQAKHARQAARP